MSRCQLTVAGPIADTVIDVIRSRFDEATTASTNAACTTLSVDVVDGAAERSLLNLLWDTGHDIVAVRSDRLSPPPNT